MRSGVQWITTCSAANVNIGQLLEMQLFFARDGVPCNSRPEHVYIAYADNSHTRNTWYRAIGSERLCTWLLYRKALSDYLMLTYTVHAHRLLGCSDCCSLATHIRLTGSMPRYKPFQASALLNMDSYYHI